MGIITMLGPIANQNSHLTAAGSDPGTSITSEEALSGYLERPNVDNIAQSQFKRLYTLPAVRGLGLGSA